MNCLKLIVVLTIVKSLAQAQEPSENAFSQINVVRNFFKWLPNNAGYQFTYELSNGLIRSEIGVYKNIIGGDGSPSKILVVKGAYTYHGPDNELYCVRYMSDEHGYQVVTGKGPEGGGLKPGEDIEIDPNLLKSLIG